ncbi:MAG: DDE-type integrase/transposase/recombinase [Nitrospirales bacterium]
MARLCSKTQHAPRAVGETWHFDELFITIQGQRQYLWQAVDQDYEL